MSNVFKQSAINTIILFIGFTIGGINVLFLYTTFLDAEYHGLITFLLSTAVIFLPFFIFGMHNTVVKFYSSYNSKEEKDVFLITSLLLPLLVIIPSTVIGIFAYEQISSWISKTNEIINNYTYLIFIIVVFMGYFELFYAWSKVQLETVFGNFVKEVFARFCTSILLIMVYFKIIDNHQFIYGIVIVYGIRLLIMLIYALHLYKPRFILKKLPNIKEVLSYSFYIIMAGSAGFILLEIDKFMIPQIQEGIENVAYYSVGIYIATVVGIPARATQQIATPVTAKAINNSDFKIVGAMYRNISLHQLLAGGLLFLLINLNLQDLYIIINRPKYNNGAFIVLLISIAKLFELAMGTNIAILSNSKYYKFYFYLSLAMALSVILLNDWLIRLYGNNGAAMATLLVVASFFVVQIFYVWYRLKMQPFTKKTIIVLSLIILIYSIFSLFDWYFNAYINILFRSIIVSILYVLITYTLNISQELNDFIKQHIHL